MKLANVKGLVTKSLVAAVAAGALLFAAPTKAQAQVFIGLRFGGRPAPVYVAPYGYYARRDAIIRHDEWVRAHRFDHRYGYR